MFWVLFEGCWGQTCDRHATDMRQTCDRHATDSPEPPDMRQTCDRHATDMRQTTQNSPDMRQTCGRHATELFIVCVGLCARKIGIDGSLFSARYFRPASSHRFSPSHHLLPTCFPPSPQTVSSPSPHFLTLLPPHSSNHIPQTHCM